MGTVPLVCCPLERSLPIEVASETKETSVNITANPADHSSNLLLEPPNCGFGNNTVGRVVGGIPAKLGKLIN